MMSKVVELANKYCEGSSFCDACVERPAYIAGYYQAEKDNELTWEDAKEIYCIALNLRDYVGSSMFGQPFYEEVLKRFKNLKGRKED